MSNRHQYSHYQLAVQEFHELIGAYTGEWPHVPPDNIKELRITLLQEELDEYINASNTRDIVGVADALADLLYVVYGAALAWGIAMGPIFAEVQRSNMTKGVGSLRSDGTVDKSRDGSFSSPNLEPLLEAQIPKEGSTFDGLRRRDS